MIDQNATGQAPVTHARRQHDPEAFDDDLEWLLVAGDSAMGAKGTMGGVVAVLEHGGQISGIPNTDPYSDQQVGWSSIGVGLVEKHRWLSAAWLALPLDARGVLTLCYQAPRAEHRNDEQTHTHTGAEAQLGRYAALAFNLTEAPAALLDACRQPSKGKNGRTIARELRKARDAAVAAHALWGAAKGTASKPRKARERRAILPVHVPGVPEAQE
jgi:hypothetical protein